ncbi:MAG: hypothetical protein R3C01_07440 [Planctomycetaceae bacterium]
MSQLFETLRDLIVTHWQKLIPILVSAFVGWFFGKRRAKQAWKNREFFDRLNFSLTTLIDGKLSIRTLVEKRCEEVFLNSVATETVIAKARQTTAADPVLQFDRDDTWYYLNAVLNELSERFSDGVVRRDLGMKVSSARYLICLTCETAGNIRTHKVRALVIQKQLLTNLPEEPPAFESPNHSTRWETIKLLATIYKATPHRFLEMELCQ